MDERQAIEQEEMARVALRAQREHDEREEEYSEEENPCGDCGEWPEDCTCADEQIEQPKKVQFNKAVFLNSIRASEELREHVKDIHDKGALLEAVFKFNNRPKKAIKYRQNRRAFEALKTLNDQSTRDYIASLESFYDGAINAFNRGEVGRFIQNTLPIKKAAIVDVKIFEHPLFKVNSLGTMRRANFGRVRNLGMRLKITTREDVFYSFGGNRINFGKFTFSILLDRAEVRFHWHKDNINYGGACPYMSGNSVCLGENSYSVNKKIREGRLFEAMTEIYTTMTVFNPESNPYRGLDRYFQRAIEGALYRRNGQKVEMEKQ